jgi:hypothetical protein
VVVMAGSTLQGILTYVLLCEVVYILSFPITNFLNPTTKILSTIHYDMYSI